MPDSQSNVQSYQYMLAAKYYIKNKEQLQKYQCSACFQINYDIMILQCACQKIFCRACLFYSPRSSCYQCGLQSLSIKHISPPKVQFQCPSSTCEAVMKSQSQFYSHCQNCSNISTQLREEYNFRATYSCSNNHLLEFQISRFPCYLCSESYLYTSLCSFCNIRYCTTCRPNPGSKSECSKGHPLIAKKGGPYTICDNCAQSIGMMENKKIFSDRVCDFDICEACHKKLPESHPLPFLKELQKGKKAANIAKRQAFN